MQEAAAAPLLLTSMGRSAAPLVEGEQLGVGRWRRRVGARRVGGGRRRRGEGGASPIGAAGEGPRAVTPGL